MKDSQLKPIQDEELPEIKEKVKVPKKNLKIKKTFPKIYIWNHP